MTETLFVNWCSLNGCQPVPAAPHMVARFVADIAPLGIDNIWSAVKEISRTHYTVGLADPTLGHPVATAMTELAEIEAPSCWTKEMKARFKTLPYDVQCYVLVRTKQDRQAMRKAQNEAAELRRAANQEEKAA